jgi:hypothetical protein
LCVIESSCAISRFERPLEAFDVVGGAAAAKDRNRRLLFAGPLERLRFKQREPQPPESFGPPRTIAPQS